MHRRYSYSCSPPTLIKRQENTDQNGENVIKLRKTSLLRSVKCIIIWSKWILNVWFVLTWPCEVDWRGVKVQEPFCLNAFVEWIHAQSIVFRHLPPNSSRFGYATGGAIFISAQLSTDAVSALRKVWVLILWEDCGSNLAPKHARKHETHPPRVKKGEKRRKEKKKKRRRRRRRRVPSRFKRF